MNVPGLFNQRYLEVPRFAFYAVDLCIGHDFYVGMPVAFNELWGFDAHGAVVCGKGLIELGHVAADGRRSIDQIDFEARRAQVEGCLYAADAAADDHYVPEVIASKVPAKSLDIVFKLYYVLHFPSPHQIPCAPCGFSRPWKRATLPQRSAPYFKRTNEATADDLFLGKEKGGGKVRARRVLCERPTPFLSPSVEPEDPT